jgi:hypothetical protein
VFGRKVAHDRLATIEEERTFSDASGEMLCRVFNWVRPACVQLRARNAIIVLIWKANVVVVFGGAKGLSAD